MDTPPRRSFQARRYPDLRGVLLGHIEDEDRLYRGMKDRFSFVVSTRGWAEFLYRGRRYHSGPGMLRLQHPGEMYSETLRETPGSYDVVLLNLPELPSDLVLPSPVLSVDDPRAAPLMRLHALLCRATDPMVRQTAAIEAAHALLGLAQPESRTPGAERGAVRRARAWLLEHLDTHVRLDDLADHVRLDKFRLIRAFRDAHGVPPYEYLTHARIYRARQLLRSGTSPSSVARTVGFYDQSQLHRHFRRIVGVTPGQYASDRHDTLPPAPPGTCMHGIAPW